MLQLCTSSFAQFVTALGMILFLVADNCHASPTGGSRQFEIGSSSDDGKRKTRPADGLDGQPLPDLNHAEEGIERVRPRYMYHITHPETFATEKDVNYHEQILNPARDNEEAVEERDEQRKMDLSLGLLSQQEYKKLDREDQFRLKLMKRFRRGHGAVLRAPDGLLLHDEDVSVEELKRLDRENWIDQIHYSKDGSRLKLAKSARNEQARMAVNDQTWMPAQEYQPHLDEGATISPPHSSSSTEPESSPCSRTRRFHGSDDVTLRAHDQHQHHGQE